MFQEDKLFNIDYFLIELIMFNSHTRGLDIVVDPKIQIDEIINEKLYYKIFTKGYSRLQELKYFIIDNMKQKSLDNEKNILTIISNIMSFIVLNQVFGDGNHRTAYFSLVTLIDKNLQYIFTDEELYFNDEIFNYINILFDNVDYVNETQLSDGSIYNFTSYQESYDPINFFDKVSRIIYLLVKQYLIVGPGRN